jgi:hypothetical protein
MDGVGSGMNAEHIYIGDEIADLARDPSNIESTETIKNRVNGVRTDLALYEEGYLRIRETRKKGVSKEHLIELRFLAAEPAVTRHLAMPCLWIALAMGLLALAASYALPLTTFTSYTIAATASLSTIAVLSLMLFVYRSQETHRFCTTTGHTAVIRLTGSFGCLRRVRRVSRRIRNAIADASGGYDVGDVKYLRAEMKAHYKLAETGVISREACSNGTAAILSKFG